MTTVNTIGNFDSVGNGRGIVPLGSIIPIAAHLSGSFPIPVSGQVLDGYQLCDGVAIPEFQSVSGNTPQLTDSRFLMGFTTAGNTGGFNAVTPAGTLSGSANIDHTHTYNHTHGTDSQLGTITLRHSHTVNFHRHEYSIALMDLNYMATGTNAAMGSGTQGGVYNYASSQWQGALPGSIFSMTRVDSSGPTPNGVPTGVGNVQQYYSTGYTGSVTDDGTNEQLTNYNASHSHTTNSQSSNTTSGATVTSVNGSSFTFNGSSQDNKPQFLTVKYIIRVN